MGNLVFPSLPGLGWNITRTPKWNTHIQQAVSGKEFRTAWMSAPLYTFRLNYEVLREATAFQELQQLVGLFNNVRGSFDSFLYSDPADGVVVGQQFGVGDGATASFQLVRAYGGNTEAVGALNGAPTIKANGTVQTSGLSIGNTGLVTFTTPPAAGVTLTWDGSYYYRCRFAQDSMEFNKFMALLWDAKTVEFVGSLSPNRI